MTNPGAGNARPEDVTENAFRALVRADAFLAAAENELPSLADALGSEERLKRMASLGNLLTGLESLARLAVELERMGVPVAADLDIARLSDSMRDLVRCQESRDWTGVSEALRARVGPLLPEWRSVLARRAGSLSGEPAASVT